MSTGRGQSIQRVGFIALWILGGIAQQVGRDAHAGVLNAKSLWRYWMSEYWPRIPAPVRAPFFAAGVAGRAVYRAGGCAGRSVAIGVRNGAEEGRERHREFEELREYPRGSEGYVHVLGHIQANRRVRADVYRSYGEQVHGATIQRREEKDEWARAVTLEDLGEVTARWAEGAIKFHPNGYDEGPDEETAELVPALAALNRAGFVTSCSQPGIGPVTGYDDRIWWQRAAVDGYTDPDTADRLEGACEEAGIIFINNGPARWRTTWKNSIVVTASPVKGDQITDDTPIYGHTEFGAHPSRRAVTFDFDGYGTDALLAAEQVTIIDPVWGRRDHLWQTIVGDAHVPVADEHNTEADEPESDHPMLTTGDAPIAVNPNAHYGPTAPVRGLARIHPDGTVNVDPFYSEHERDREDKYYPDLNVRPESNPVSPHVYFNPDKGWIFEATGWPVPDRITPVNAHNNGDLGPDMATDRETEVGPLDIWMDGKHGSALYTDVTAPSEEAALEAVRQDYVAKYGAPPTSHDLWTQPRNTNSNGGTAMTAPTPTPTGTAGGDITTIPALERAYNAAEPAMATAKDIQSAAASDYRAQAASLEAAAAQIAADGHDEATVSETYAAMSAMLDAAARADEAAAAADAALAAINGARTGIRRHDALREAVNSHAGHAHTDAFREG